MYCITESHSNLTNCINRFLKVVPLVFIVSNFSCTPPAEMGNGAERSESIFQLHGFPSDSDFISAEPSCKDCIVINRVHENLPLSALDFLKARLFDQKTGLSYEVALLPNGERVDASVLEEQEDNAVRSLRGTIHPSLDQWMALASEGDLIKVWFWIKTWEEGEDRAAIAEDPLLRELIITEHQAMIANASEAFIEDLGTLGAETGTLSEVPVVWGTVSAAMLEVFRWDGRVASIYPAPGPGIPTCDTYVESIEADKAHVKGWTGNGQKVSEKEGCQPDDYSPLFVVETASPSGCTSPHARAVLGIMRSTVAPYGVSPGAVQYMANEGGYIGPPPSLDEWLGGRSVRVRNVSAAYNYPCASGYMDAHDRWVDYVATHSPYPMFAVVAGNYGDSPPCDYVSHKCYNCLQVGASDENGTTMRSDDVIWPASSWKNPITPHNDRELPALVAPGVGVDGAGICGTGTSLSCPMVAGTAAIIHQRNPVLAVYPEVVWALARVNANEDVDSTFLDLGDSVDDKDGAGELNTYLTVYYAGSEFKVNGGNPAASSGFDYGLMRSGSDFSGGYYVESYNVSRVSGCTLVATLVWDSEASCSTASCPRPAYCDCTYDIQGMDLDIRLFHGSSLVDGSYSYDNTYEYFRYNIPPGTGDFQLRIWKWWSNANQTYFAVAWNVFC
jgi:hypothetical protein